MSIKVNKRDKTAKSLAMISTKELESLLVSKNTPAKYKQRYEKELKSRSK